MRMTPPPNVVLVFALAAVSGWSAAAEPPADATSCGDPVSLRSAIEDLARRVPGGYPRADEFLRRRADLQAGWNDNDPAGRAAFRQLQRESLLANPLLLQSSILFVVRQQYAPDHHNTGTDFQPGEISERSFRPGAAIKTIDLGQGGRVTTLLDIPQGAARDLEVGYFMAGSPTPEPCVRILSHRHEGCEAG